MLISTSKKEKKEEGKVQAGNEWSNISLKSSQATRKSHHIWVCGFCFFVFLFFVVVVVVVVFWEGGHYPMVNVKGRTSEKFKYQKNIYKTKDIANHT